MATRTEQYIKQAVQEAKKELGGNTIANCNIQMHMEAEGATQILAEALRAQAEANEANSAAILALAQTLKPTDACAIRVTQEGVKLGGGE